MFLRTRLHKLEHHNPDVPDNYQQLLDATIDYLGELKSRGERFIPGSFDLTRLLPFPRPRPAAPAQSSSAEPPLRPPAELRDQPRDVLDRAPRAAPAPVALDDGRESALLHLRERAQICVMCPHLAASRTSVVFGEGDIYAPVMFVGEAPGADEDQQGRPFVGRAGQLLTRMIQAMGFTRESVYIANILKCRPDKPGEKFGNRKPTPEEMRTCSPYLFAQVDLIKPKVLVALGATAAEGLLGRSVSITRLRGQFQEFRGIPLMPTYHPSYLLHNSALTEKRKVWEDMLQVLSILGRPISEKQHAFFLKGS